MFWSGQNCAIITEVLDYPRKRVLHYFLLGGDLEEILKLEPLITAWGKEQGCTAASGVGRPGFQRATANNGFKPAWVCVYKDI